MRRLAGTGSDAFANVGLAGAPSAANPHTAFAVIGTPTLPATGASYRALQLATAGVGFANLIQVNDAGGAVFQARNASNALVYSHTQAGVFSAGGAEHALALVFDGTNLIAYVDGAQVNSAAVTLGARGAFNLYNSQTDFSASTAMDVGHVMMFDAALTAAEIRTLGRVRVPVGTRHANLRGWWPYRSGPFANVAADLSAYKQTLNIGGATTVGAPDERWVGDMRRAKVFLPQYMLQPPIVLTAGNRTHAPNVALTSSAVVASTAAATSNCPSAAISASMVVASTAAASSNAPSASITGSAPVASVAANTTNVPSVTLLNAPAVASTAGNVTNAPTASIAPNYPIVSVAGSVSGSAAAITAGAPVASVAASVTDAPSTNIAGGLGATASSTTDCPPVTLARDLPIVSAASSTTSATAAVGSSAPVVQTPAQNVTNAPSATITASGVVTSVAASTTAAPAAAIAAGASVSSIAASVSNCPSVALAAARVVAAVGVARTDCPPANVVVAVSYALAAACSSRSDCPPVYLFQSVTIPPLGRNKREWPPRLR